MDREKSGQRYINSAASQKGLEVKQALTHTVRVSASWTRGPQVALRQPRGAAPRVFYNIHCSTLPCLRTHVQKQEDGARCATTEAWKK